MSRASNTDSRRAQIVQALVDVMAKQGYDGASIADIAKRAGLAPGLVHYHFKNKLEILVEAVRALAAAHARALDGALATADADDAAAQLVAFIDVHLGLGAHADPDALACWVLVSAEALRERRVRIEVEAALADLTRRVIAIVERGRASGQFQCSDAGAVAAALVAMIQGYFTVAATARELIPSGSAAPCALRMAEGLVRPKRPLEIRRKPTRARRV
ncbi:MAG: TetR/AcrR family transcriptional regulator [Kofleriaceae bacterium]|nr:TetR/AcrR family transcriptional regulator [Kofleriaceae bacterium]